VRVLLIEDSRRLRESLCLGMKRLGYVLDLAADGEEGLALASSGRHDVVILDLMLPKLDGISLLRRLREKGSDAHVLILTAKDAVPDRVAGLQAGADDYLVKPFAFDELVARVQALARRKHGVKTPAISVGDLMVETTHRRVTLAGHEIVLRPREYALLEFLAFRKGRVVGRPAIEDAIYDGRGAIESNAVDSAVCALRRCIDLPDQPSFIETRRGLGYVLRDPDSADAH
jgi:DNA-binding response OmpR family regulator